MADEKLNILDGISDSITRIAEIKRLNKIK